MKSLDGDMWAESGDSSADRKPPGSLKPGNHFARFQSGRKAVTLSPSHPDCPLRASEGHPRNHE